MLSLLVSMSVLMPSRAENKDITLYFISEKMDNNYLVNNINSELIIILESILKINQEVCLNKWVNDTFDRIYNEDIIKIVKSLCDLLFKNIKENNIITNEISLNSFKICLSLYLKNLNNEFLKGLEFCKDKYNNDKVTKMNFLPSIFKKFSKNLAESPLPWCFCKFEDNVAFSQLLKAKHRIIEFYCNYLFVKRKESYISIKSSSLNIKKYEINHLMLPCIDWGTFKFILEENFKKINKTCIIEISFQFDAYICNTLYKALSQLDDQSYSFENVKNKMNIAFKEKMEDLNITTINNFSPSIFKNDSYNHCHKNLEIKMSSERSELFGSRIMLIIQKYPYCSKDKNKLWDSAHRMYTGLSDHAEGFITYLLVKIKELQIKHRVLIYRIDEAD